MPLARPSKGAVRKDKVLSWVPPTRGDSLLYGRCPGAGLRCLSALSAPPLPREAGRGLWVGAALVSSCLGPGLGVPRRVS